MSIITLKRKTTAKYGRHSTQNGFSLNNSRRIHSTMDPTHTPFIGVDPKGHGGYFGNYVINVQDPKCCNTSDPFNEPKPTTLSNHALLSKKLRPLYGGYPANVVQPTKENDYETFVQSKVANLKHNNQVSGTCETYQQTTGPMDYATYMATKLKKNKCLAPPKLTFPPKIQRNNVMGCYESITYEEYVKQQEC